MTREFSATIRGTEVTVYCEDFSGDESVGIPYGPETVYAKTLDGDEFPLTDEEIDEWTVTGTEAAYEDDTFLDGPYQ